MPQRWDSVSWKGKSPRLHLPSFGQIEIRPIPGCRGVKSCELVLRKGVLSLFPGRMDPPKVEVVRLPAAALDDAPPAPALSLAVTPEESFGNAETGLVDQG
jgi:hypothetical protein